MRDLGLLFITTLIVFAMWVGLELFSSSSIKTIDEKLLEISLPLNGTIDVEYIRNLENPAYE